MHSDLLGLSSLGPGEYKLMVFPASLPFVLERNSQFKICSIKRSAAAQTLASETSELDSIILLATLLEASCAQQ